MWALASRGERVTVGSDCCFLNRAVHVWKGKRATWEVVSSLTQKIFKQMTKDLAVVCGRFKN